MMNRKRNNSRKLSSSSRLLCFWPKLSRATSSASLCSRRVPCAALHAYVLIKQSCLSLWESHDDHHEASVCYISPIVINHGVNIFLSHDVIDKKSLALQGGEEVRARRIVHSSPLRILAASSGGVGFI